MRYFENPQVRDIYLRRVVDMMSGARGMDAVSYADRDNSVIHLSDLQGCMLVPYYRLSTPKEKWPCIDPQSALRFLRGRVIERAIAKELPPKISDGISCTVDDWLEDWGIVEIKSTMEGSEFWNPVKEHPEWVTRMKGYCYVHAERESHLVVYFLAGNMPNYTPWSIKEHGRVISKKEGGAGYKGVDFKAWTFQFTDDEIKENWARMLEAKDTIELAVSHGVPPDIETVEPTVQSWHCKMCGWQDTCYYYREVVEVKK